MGEQPLPLITLPQTLTVPAVPETVPETVTETVTETLVETAVEEVTAFQEEAAPPEQEEVTVEEVVVNEPLTDVKEQTDDQSPDISTQPAPLNWRSVQGIECLIFKVAGLKLAIPLPLLGGVNSKQQRIKK